MKDNEFPEFGRLMIAWGEISAGNEEMRNPSDKKKEFYFAALRDLSLDQIIDNAVRHFKRNKWFPAICELRNEDENSQAIEAYNDIKEAMFAYYEPMLGNISLDTIQEHLKNKGKEYLKPLLFEWGTEIHLGQNPSATRSQFIKAFNTEIKGIDTSRQIEGKKSKLIPQGIEVTAEQLEARTKMVKARNKEIKQLNEYNENIFEQERQKLEKIREELHK